MNSHQPTRLRLEGVSRRFPGVAALTQVSFDLRQGEVHALCGENGAGKSTLMNILAGNLQPDEGSLFLDNQPVTFPNPLAAWRAGIGMVYQERSLVDALSVAENVFAHQLPTTRFGFIDRRQLHDQTRQLLDRLHLSAIRPATEVGRLSAAQKQMVEIAKALARRPDILILDEPTAFITEQETRVLFDLIRSLKREGVAVIYISHRMAEIFTIADRVTVLKDGVVQGTRPVSELDADSLIRLMVGRELLSMDYVPTIRPATVLEVTGLRGKGFSDITFTLHQGEILALAGLVGAGRTEIALALFGAEPAREGIIRVDGQAVSLRSTADAIAAGIGYVPEDRKRNGLFPDMGVTENILAAHPGAATRRGLLDQRIGKRLAGDFREQLRIVTPDLARKVSHLSGGNQQKVLLARWLLRNPAVLIVDEPTHGVDVGAKQEIYKILRQLARQGTAILLISSELPEVLTLADRILVVRNGKLATELSRREATEETILHYASGTNKLPL